jgi:hypothetical protein
MELVEEELACDYCLLRGRDEAHISYFVWRSQTEDLDEMRVPRKYET